MRVSPQPGSLLATRGRHGVLPDKHLLEAVDVGVIRAGGFEIPPTNVQPASLDLRLGDVAFRLQCSFLAGKDTVADKVKDYTIDRLDLHRNEGTVLEPGRPYLIPLKEELFLPDDIRGRANPKSSTGRLDVFTRLITDYSARFDDVAAGYSGPLYLEVVPLSFPIRVRENLTLNQLRLAVGDVAIEDGEIRQMHEIMPILYRDGMPLRPDELPLINGELFLGLDLRGDPETRQVGYRARENTPHLDLTSSGPVDPSPYWEPVQDTDGRLILSRDKFYLLMSNEAIQIPPTIAGEMAAYDPTNGELRTHYAGFFDPGFGYDPAGRFQGSRAALEVRAHDIPFVIEHGQRVCKLTFERMLEAPLTPYGSGIGSSYQQQEETLAKYFYRRLPPRAFFSAPESEQLSLPLNPP